MTERVTLLCPRCGAPLPAASESDVVTCAFCGTASTPSADAAHPVQTATAPATPSALACPRCEAPLFEGRANDVVLLGCGECAGIWLDNTSAQLALKTLDRKITELSLRASSRVTSTVPQDARVKCPVCQTRMPRTHVASADVDVDACAQHGTWFDRGELVAILEAMRPRAPAATPIDRPLDPAEIPDFKKGTLTPDPVDAGIVAAGAFAVLGALLAAGSKS